MAFHRTGLIIALMLASVLPAQAFKNFSLGSASMAPTLFEDDTVTVAFYGVDYDALAKGTPLDQATSDDLRFEPKLGEIAVFQAETATVYVKRIVALSGQRVQMRGGVLHLDGMAVPTTIVPPPDEEACRPDQRCTFLRETLPNGSSYIVVDSEPASQLDETEEFLVPDGHVFMMGDNRDNSADSRLQGGEFSAMGFVPRDALIGRVTGVWLNWSHAPGAERLAGYPSR